MYEKYPKLCITSLAISLLAYYFSPGEDLRVDVPVVSAQETKAPTKKVQQEYYASLLSGAVSYSGFNLGTGKIYSHSAGTSKVQGVHEAPKCDVSCKISTLKKLGIRDEIARSIVANCKELSLDPVHCIKVASSIVTAESGGGAKCYKNGCFGILAGGISYKTKEEGVKDWVKRYTKHWYKQKNPNSFYSNSPNWKPKTRYCLSEKQSDGTMLPYCKNGHKHAWNIFNKLEKEF